MTDFESFPAEFEYLSRGMGVQSLFRDAQEEFFSPLDWRRLAGGESVIWHDEFGVKYVVTRCDDPLDRDEFLVTWNDKLEEQLANLEFTPIEDDF